MPSSSGSASHVSSDSEVLEHRALRARQAVAALRDRLALLESSTGKELASLRAQLEAQQIATAEAREAQQRMGSESGAALLQLRQVARDSFGRMRARHAAKIQAAEQRTHAAEERIAEQAAAHAAREREFELAFARERAEQRALRAHCAKLMDALTHHRFFIREHRFEESTDPGTAIFKGRENDAATGVRVNDVQSLKLTFF